MKNLTPEAIINAQKKPVFCKGCKFYRPFEHGGFMMPMFLFGGIMNKCLKTATRFQDYEGVWWLKDFSDAAEKNRDLDCSDFEKKKPWWQFWKKE